MDKTKRTTSSGEIGQTMAIRRRRERASHSPRPKPGRTRLTIGNGSPIHSIWLLNPGPLKVPIIPIIVSISVLNADPRRPSVGERRRLSFNTPVVTVISDKRGVLSGLVIGGREHFAGTRYELVERR